jgi:hypothetical protein
MEVYRYNGQTETVTSTDTIRVEYLIFLFRKFKFDDLLSNYQVWLLWIFEWLADLNMFYVPAKLYIRFVIMQQV